MLKWDEQSHVFALFCFWHKNIKINVFITSRFSPVFFSLQALQAPHSWWWFQVWKFWGFASVRRCEFGKSWKKLSTNSLPVQPATRKGNAPLLTLHFTFSFEFDHRHRHHHHRQCRHHFWHGHQLKVDPERRFETHQNYKWTSLLTIYIINR